jgi:triosephosphate isomerase (TIM)
MRRPVFAANWKMNHGPRGAAAFMESFLPGLAPIDERTAIFFPPALSLCTLVDALSTRTDILLGVQNIYWEEKGAFTGENSAMAAREAGASVALVGHSERRHLFGETDEQTAKKCAAAARAGLVPMLCVGEKLDERERNATRSVVLRQLNAGLSELRPDQIGTMAVAYEPVWAIGTGKTARPEDAQEVHAVIRQALRAIIGASAAEVPILYGGSVTVNNASALLAAPEVDGLLVGGASLDPAGWTAIVRT